VQGGVRPGKALVSIPPEKRIREKLLKKTNKVEQDGGDYSDPSPQGTRPGENHKKKKKNLDFEIKEKEKRSRRRSGGVVHGRKKKKKTRVCSRLKSIGGGWAGGNKEKKMGW